MCFKSLTKVHYFSQFKSSSHLKRQPQVLNCAFKFDQSKLKTKNLLSFLLVYGSSNFLRLSSLHRQRCNIQKLFRDLAFINDATTRDRFCVYIRTISKVVDMLQLCRGYADVQMLILAPHEEVQKSCFSISKLVSDSNWLSSI